MKEAIGGISLFQIVIVFLLLFTGIMCLTINHSKAFGVKDEIINIIENDKIAASGSLISNEKLESIKDHLAETGYRNTGKCPDSEWTGYDRAGGINNNDAAFCLRAVNVAEVYYDELTKVCSNEQCVENTGDFPEMYYYEVIVFYQLDIPAIKQLMNFKLKGTTKILFE